MSEGLSSNIAGMQESAEATLASIQAGNEAMARRNQLSERGRQIQADTISDSLRGNSALHRLEQQRAATRKKMIDATIGSKEGFASSKNMQGIRDWDSTNKAMESLQDKMESLEKTLSGTTTGLGKFNVALKTGSLLGSSGKGILAAAKNKDWSALRGHGSALSTYGGTLRQSGAGQSVAGRTVAGGIARTGSLIANAARLGPVVGAAVALIGGAAKVSMALNKFRADNVSKYMEVGGPNVRSNTTDKGGSIGGFNARQYAYNKFRYNSSIKYGLDAGEMHDQVFSQFANSGISTEGLNQMYGTNSDTGAQHQKGHLGTTKYKDDGTVSKQDETFDDVAKKTFDISTTLGINMAEASADQAKYILDYGNETKRMGKIYGNVAEAANRAGTTSQFMLDKVNSLGSAFQEAGGFMDEFAQGMGKAMNVMGGGKNQMAKYYQDVMNPYSQMRGGKGLNRMAMQLGGGRMYSEISKNLKLNNKLLKSSSANERIRARRSINVLKSAANGGAMGLMGYASNQSAYMDPAEAMKNDIAQIKSMGGLKDSDFENNTMNAQVMMGAMGWDENQQQGMTMLAGSIKAQVEEGMDASGAKSQGEYLKNLASKIGDVSGMSNNDLSTKIMSMQGLTDVDKSVLRMSGTSGIKSIQDGDTSTMGLTSAMFTGNKDEALATASAYRDGGGGLSTKQMEAVVAEKTDLGKLFSFTADQVKFFASESDTQRFMSKTLVGIYQVAEDILTSILDSDKGEEVVNARSTIGKLTEAMGKAKIAENLTADGAKQLLEGTGLRNTSELMAASSPNGVFDKELFAKAIGVKQNQISSALSDPSKSASEISDLVKGNSAGDYLGNSEEAGLYKDVKREGLPAHASGGVIDLAGSNGQIKNPNGSTSIGDRLAALVSPGEAVVSGKNLMEMVSNTQIIKGVYSSIADLSALVGSLKGTAYSSNTGGDTNYNFGGVTIQAPANSAKEISEAFQSMLTKWVAQQKYNNRLRQNVVAAGAS